MTTIADREWRLVPEEARPGPVQMALEEVAARTAVEDGVRTVRVYSWEPSTLSLGYGQDPDTVDWEFCDREGIDVTRRPTGGGGIYHDRRGDISYSIVAPADELPGDLMECYSLLCEPILDAFARLDVDAAFAESEHPSLYEPSCYLRGIHPAHDVVVNGRKVSGNAQYRQRDAVIQHGSISYDLRPERHRGAFAAPDVTADAFRERVTSLRREAGVEREAAVEAFEDVLAEWCSARDGAWSDAELDAARDLADRKYENPAWNRDREVPADAAE